LKNIFILPEYWNSNFIGACGWIRLLNPFLNPNISGHFNVEYGYSLETAKNNPDVVIFERLWHPNDTNIYEYHKLLISLKKKGVKIVYSIDDNLIDFQIFQKNDWFSSNHLSVVNLFMHYADVVVVSTPSLKERLSAINNRINVILNAVDPKNIKENIANRNNDKIKFGFLASPDNEAYLFSILEPLKAILHRYKNHVLFEIIGHNSPYLSPALFKSLPVKLVVPPDASYKKYTNWLRDNCNWDFGIAPIIKNNFTKCKSDMKFLDFTQLGIPGVYTDYTPYDIVGETKSGLLVQGDWIEKLSLMIENHEKRTELLDSAIDYVSNFRNTTIQISEWKQLIDKL